MIIKILKVTCFSLVLVIFQFSNLSIADPIACDNPDSKFAHQIQKDLSANRFLNDRRNCGHPGYAAKVKESRPLVDKAIDELWANIDQKSKEIDKSISGAFANRIDFLVPGSGSKKSYEDFGIKIPRGNESKVKAMVADVSDARTSYDRIKSLTDNLLYRHDTSVAADEGKVSKARAELTTEDTKSFINALREDSVLNNKIKTSANQKSCIDGYALKFVPENFQRNAKLGQSGPEGIKGANVNISEARKQLAATEVPGKILKCTDPVLSRAKLVAVSEAKPITIKAGGRFADNQDSLKDEAAFIADVKRQLPSSPGCKTTIKSVQVLTSSSLNRNTCLGLTGEKADNCHQNEAKLSYDFMGLSARRGENIEKALKQNFSANIAFSHNYGGDNGDGTSGPCPYTTDETTDQVRKLKPEELSETLKSYKVEDLNAFKYVNLDVDAVQEGENCTVAKKEKTTEQIYMTEQCFEVQVECKGAQTAAK